MVGQSPSIQSFFPPSPIKGPPVSPPVPGDGFTPEEPEAALIPAQSDTWKPQCDYEKVDIGSLQPGLQRVKILGRIVNLSENLPFSKSAEHALHLFIKDDTGVINVKLVYARRKYSFRIGDLVTTWITNITNGDRNMFPCPTAPLFARISPEKDKSCHIQINSDDGDQNLCRTPADLQRGLMALESFIHGGFEANDAKILVIVKSISARKRVTTKNASTVDLINVGVMDGSEEGSLSLWGTACASANNWITSTVLLISRPSLNSAKKNWLSLNSNTFVEVNPDVVEAAWLRKFAESLMKRNHINPSFPQQIYDKWSTTKPAEHVLYTLADVDARARETPHAGFEGYLSVIIMELNMTTLRLQNMLLCNECCGIPIYSNSNLARCKQCDRDVPLGINPRLIGKLIDESGCITTGNLVLSDKAWQQLLGRSVHDLIGSETSLIRSIEQRMLFVRITLRFWWSGEMGKLAVVEVLE